MKRSSAVQLTVVAAMGLAARAQQPPPDPCSPATFNGQVCQAAIRQGGFCSQGAWVPMSYPQGYPDYYDAYGKYVQGGGAVNPLQAEHCRRPRVARGGFGATGAAYHSAGG